MKKTVLLFTVLVALILKTNAQMGNQLESNYQKLTDNIELRGLVQVRFQVFDDTAKMDGFDFRRARLDFKGNIAPKFGYRLHAELAGAPKVLDAIFIYKPFEYLHINAGQSKYPISYDNLYGPWNLITINRTQLDNFLVFRENDLYGNQNGRDIGLWLSGKFNIGNDGNERPFIDYSIGVYNGAGINATDNNRDKDIAGALGVSPIKNLWIYGRYLSGSGRTISDPGVDADRERLGSNISYKFKNWIVEAEYLSAADKSDSLALLKRNAFYATIGYMAIQNKLQFVARFDNLDPNENVGDNVINKYVLASSYFFNKNTRIQVEYDFVREQTVSQIKNNLLAIQVQAAF